MDINKNISDIIPNDILFVLLKDYNYCLLLCKDGIKFQTCIVSLFTNNNLKFNTFPNLQKIIMPCDMTINYNKIKKCKKLNYLDLYNNKVFNFNDIINVNNFKYICLHNNVFVNNCKKDEIFTYNNLQKYEHDDIKLLRNKTSIVDTFDNINYIETEEIKKYILNVDLIQNENSLNIYNKCIFYKEKENIEYEFNDLMNDLMDELTIENDVIIKNDVIINNEYNTFQNENI